MKQTGRKKVDWLENNCTTGAGFVMYLSSPGNKERILTK